MAAKKKTTSSRMYAVIKRYYRVRMINAAKTGGKYGIKQLAKDYHQKYGEKFETFYQRIVKQAQRDKAKGNDWNEGIELLIRTDKETIIDDANYHGESTDMAAFDAALEYGTLEGIGIVLKIPTKTVNRWMKQYESFSDLVTDGLNKAKAKVEYSLKKLGETNTLVEKREEKGYNGQGSFDKKVEITKEVSGNVSANLAWLAGNDKEKYGKDKEEKKNTKDVINIVIGGK